MHNASSEIHELSKFDWPIHVCKIQSPISVGLRFTWSWKSCHERQTDDELRCIQMELNNTTENIVVFWWIYCGRGHFSHDYRRNSRIHLYTTTPQHELWYSEPPRGVHFTNCEPLPLLTNITGQFILKIKDTAKLKFDHFTYRKYFISKSKIRSRENQNKAGSFRRWNRIMTNSWLSPPLYRLQSAASSTCRIVDPRSSSVLPTGGTTSTYLYILFNLHVCRELLQ